MSDTQEQAMEKVCPVMGGEKCVASLCMGWRWSRAKETAAYLASVQEYMLANSVNFNIANQKVYAEIGSKFDRAEGYCGQFGRPE